jgi:hypothetical protein
MYTHIYIYRERDVRMYEAASHLSHYPPSPFGFHSATLNVAFEITKLSAHCSMQLLQCRTRVFSVSILSAFSGHHCNDSALNASSQWGDPYLGRWSVSSRTSTSRLIYNSLKFLESIAALLKFYASADNWCWCSIILSSHTLTLMSTQPIRLLQWAI